MEDTAGEVVAVAQRRLKARRAERPFERSVLESAIDQAAEFLEVSGTFDRDVAIAELETREAITIGRATKLVDEVGHVPWYFGDRQRPGPFFRRYRDYLLDYESWGDTAVDALADATDEILEQLEDPHRPGPWDRRGLVVGHVQSGKTANYAGLMCKAGDAGYRLIVVLAGMHNALRKQTQQRLDRDFLGFSTLPVPDGTPRETIGAGLINPSVHADFITNQAINGDFNRNRVESQGTGPGEHPLLMVVKKNASVLRNLNTWVKDFLERRGDTRTVPLLVIDDEADQASVDTGDQDFDGDVPDPDYEPTRINGQIRALLDAFDRSAYVAYTATPFANILIHDERVADKFGADLFPKSFIVNLAAPSTYIGPADLFGVNGDPGAQPPPPPLPLTRTVNQVAEGWIEAPHKSDFVPLTDGQRRIAKSLEDAILSFVLACAARRARGNPTAHNSMLVHVSRFKAVQLIVHGEIDTWFKDVTRQLIYRTGAEALLDRLRTLWEDDFVPTTARVAATKYGRALTPLSWEEVDAHLTAAAESIVPRLVNSEIKEPLDYDAAKDHGLNIIAIGGDKLSRGLTLEGLTVSYFLRQSTAYDSLMQMGRWFGYRPGYTDLCRLYTTSDMTAWFRHVATAAEELREQLDHMAALGATPKDYGLKIQSHDHLLVTASNKMRYAEEVQVTFAGEGKNQTVFSTAQGVIDHNAAAIASLLSEAGEPTDVGRSGDRTWRGVDGNLVAACLGDMIFPPESYNVNGLRLSQYIRAQLEHAELTEWTVALRAGDGPELDLGPFRVKTVKRAPVDDRKREERHIIQTALSPRDESIDLDEDQFRAALALTNAKRQKKGLPETDTPGGTEIRRIRGLGDEQTGLLGHPERGLLLIYPLSPLEAGLTSKTPIVALVVSFPASKTARPITYRYNTVLSRMELASQ
jgi:hypothetical protein